MARGKIKTIVEAKGFGFIAGEKKGSDTFFHCSAVRNIAFEDLQIGQEVEFEAEKGEKGPRATSLQPV